MSTAIARKFDAKVTFGHWRRATSDDGWDHYETVATVTTPKGSFSTAYHRGLLADVSEDDALHSLTMEALAYRDSDSPEDFAIEFGYMADLVDEVYGKGYPFKLRSLNVNLHAEHEYKQAKKILAIWDAIEREAEAIESLGLDLDALADAFQDY